MIKNITATLAGEVVNRTLWIYYDDGYNGILLTYREENMPTLIDQVHSQKSIEWVVDWAIEKTRKAIAEQIADHVEIQVVGE
jgi:hypothetical protein